MEIIKNSNCSAFKLLGYKFNDMRLILYFYDCNQVFDFVKLPNEIKITKFFTKDHIDTHEMLKTFEAELDFDKPE